MAMDSVGGGKSARTGSVENFLQGRAGCTDKTRAMKNICLQICEEGHNRNRGTNKKAGSCGVRFKLIKISSYKKQPDGSFF